MDHSFYPCNQTPLDQVHTRTRFRNQVVIAAGGASGIGFAVAHRFCNDGAKVAILDINKELSEAAIKHLNAEGFEHKVKFYHVDVTDKANCNEVVKLVVSDNGGLHHLAYSVAYYGSKDLTAELQDWRKSFDVNVVGYANMVQACYPYMSKGCSVVGLSSVSEHRAQRNRWTYSATKGAIGSLTRCMALELSEKGIRVNSVSPTWIWSPEEAKAVPSGLREDILPIVEKYHMLRRDGETSEVAATIAFLCSKDASFITGANIPVDGGYCALGPEALDQNSMFAGAHSE